MKKNTQSSINHEALIRALSLIRPGAEWGLLGDTYSGLEWLDKKQPKPTLDEINQALKLLPKYGYQDFRIKEYPSLADQLDAIWKHFNSLSASGQTLHPETKAMLDRINAVKAKYPRFQEPK